MSLRSSENKNYADHLTGPIFEAVSQSAAELGGRTFVIGGFVRDLLLERPTKDIDFVIEGSGIELANSVAEKLGVKTVAQYKNFGTAMFHFDGVELEFVGARKENYERNSRKPIVEDGTIENDQDRRDFTINALALSLNADDLGTLVDPFNGVKDLEAGLIRTPLEPDTTYSDDPLRMLRAIRFAAQLDFKIEEASMEAIGRNAHRMEIVSQERIADELNKLVLCKRPSKGFKLLNKSGLLDIVFPDLAHMRGVDVRNGMGHKDNFYHTLEVLDNISENTDDLWLRWAAILHDIAKPATKRFQEGHGWTFHGHEDKGARMVPEIFKRMRLPLDSKMKYVQKLVRLHLRPIALTKEEITDAGIRRLLFDAGDDLDDLMTLCEADITTKNPDKMKRYLNRFKQVRIKLKEVEERDRIRNWQPPISGQQIMETFNIGPCKEVGMIKNAIKEAILEGHIKNDYLEAYKYMVARGSELGLTPIKAN